MDKNKQYVLPPDWISQVDPETGNTFYGKWNGYEWLTQWEYPMILFIYNYHSHNNLEQMSVPHTNLLQIPRIPQTPVKINNSPVCLRHRQAALKSTHESGNITGCMSRSSVCIINSVYYR